MENVILTLSWTGSILSIFLLAIGFLLPKERRAIHEIIVSCIAILLKIGIIITLIVIKLNIILEILIGIITVSFVLVWGLILWISIIKLRVLKKSKECK